MLTRRKTPVNCAWRFKAKLIISKHMKKKESLNGLLFIRTKKFRLLTGLFQ
jgi:hypothetical protein